MRNASRYRQLLQADLPAVFTSFAQKLAAMSDEDVIVREAFKRCTLRVLRVWKDWYLFSDEVIAGLQATLLMQCEPAWRNVCTQLVEVRSHSTS